jgi:hypothetical protein
MNKQAKAEWVAALRSGKYRQGIGSLAVVDPDTGAEAHCCLGVACEVFGERLGLTVDVRDCDNTGRLRKGWIDPENGGWEANVLPISVAFHLGFDEYNTNPRLGEPVLVGEFERLSLAELNDQGKTFPEIADIIEEQL